MQARVHPTTDAPRTDDPDLILVQAGVDEARGEHGPGLGRGVCGGRGGEVELGEGAVRAPVGCAGAGGVEEAEFG